jgi:hypothetical protein
MHTDFIRPFIPTCNYICTCRKTHFFKNIRQKHRRIRHWIIVLRSRILYRVCQNKFSYVSSRGPGSLQFLEPGPPEACCTQGHLFWNTLYISYWNPRIHSCSILRQNDECCLFGVTMAKIAHNSRTMCVIVGVYSPTCTPCKCWAHLPREERPTRDVTFEPICKVHDAWEEI